MKHSYAIGYNGLTTGHAFYAIGDTANLKPLDASLTNLSQVAKRASVAVEQATNAINALSQTASNQVDTIQENSFDINVDIPQFDINDFKVEINEEHFEETAPKQNQNAEIPNEQPKSNPCVTIPHARIILAHDTEENWLKSTRILKYGEIALVETPTCWYAVVGDGEHKPLECKRLSFY